MNRKALLQALKQLGIGISDVRRDNVSVHCPFTWKHEGGTDKSASCSFKVDEFGPSLYYCFTCREEGTIEVLAQRLARMEECTHETAALVAELERTGISDTLPTYEEETEPKWRKLVDTVSWKTIPRYLLSRGLTMETCKTWKLGYDREKGRAVFPVWDVFGNGVGMSGRVLGDTDSGEKYLAYPGFRKSHVLYGEHLLDKIEGKRKIVVVEGFLDVLIAWQIAVPYCVLATMGCSLHKKQAQTLCVWADEIVVFYDNDEAGWDGADKAVELLSSMITGDIKVRAVRNYDKGKLDPKDYSRDDFVRIVDQAEEINV